MVKVADYAVSDEDAMALRDVPGGWLVVEAAGWWFAGRTMYFPNISVSLDQFHEDTEPEARQPRRERHHHSTSCRVRRSSMSAAVTAS